MTKIAFTGGRDHALTEHVITAFKVVASLANSLWGTSKTPYEDTLHIAVGCCPTGIDKYVRDFFGNKDSPDFWTPCTLTVFKADWDTHKLAAGPIRNRSMLQNFKPKVLIAFPGGKGTDSCISIAKELKIPVKTFNGKSWDPL